MGWHGHLALSYRRDGDRTVAFDRHSGPLRILRSLYPEGGGICHNVLLHPPGGIVGGDVLAIDLALAEGTHALLTTPGATRFYRSTGATAEQSLEVRVGPGARLEWLPLETLAYSGCLAANHSRFILDAGAEMIGWDLTALGLPAAEAPFVTGRFTQRIELPGRWLERGSVVGAEPGLLDSPLGWAGQRVLATLFLATGDSALAPARSELLLDAARAVIADHALQATAGATAPHPAVMVVRALAPRVEIALQLLTSIWLAWRRAAWGLAPCPPRVWRT